MADEVREKTWRLERSNEDLRQYAYAASHDLQEPLRVISAFSELLQRRYKGRLDPEADEFLEFIVGETERMRRIILDVLAFSRVDSTPANRDEVDLAALVDEVAAELRRLDEADGAEIVHEGLPVVRGDRVLLRQLFRNLLSNALKFRAERPPRVVVAARRGEAEWRITVTDNGIGLDPAHRERVFGMFKRLHTQERYRGSGIGLAIARRVVERHGGVIGIESSPGEGATLWFTLADSGEAAGPADAPR
jgi:light-regulated signal transduction histidine kinase (bacteriophytochrome)